MQELAVPIPFGTPGSQETAVGREHLHPVVEGICDKHMAVAIDRDPFGLPELARPASFEPHARTNTPSRVKTWIRA